MLDTIDVDIWIFICYTFDEQMPQIREFILVPCHSPNPGSTHVPVDHVRHFIIFHHI